MATSIRDTLDALSPDARARLIYALNAGISLVEPHSDGRFVGVHVNNSTPHIRIEATTGNWACGTLVRAKP